MTANDQPPHKTELPFDADEAARGLQRGLRSAGPVAAASYTLIGAIVFLGGLGYVADRWLDTGPWLLLGGLLLGIVVGFYELARVVWRR